MVVMAATKKTARLLALYASCDAKAEASQQQPDVWRKIFDFLPRGHYLQLASVSTAWRALYVRSLQPRGPARCKQHTDALAMVLSMPLIQWAVANGCTMTTSVLSSAAVCGTLEVVQFVYAKVLHGHTHYFRDVPVCQAAAARGDLDMLQWARARRFDWGASTSEAAAFGGHLEVLQWAHASGCPLDVSTCTAAACGGHLEVLRWAHDAGCEWNEHTCNAAAAGGHLLVLQYARSHGCPWSTHTPSGAAYHGHLQLLQWAHANGCPFDAFAYSAAVRGGHLHVLRWLHEVRCPCDADACVSAAGQGRIDILQLLRAQGCPWDGEVCTMAMNRGRMELLQWARANGCLWKVDESLEFLARIHYIYDARDYISIVSTVEWALANGCPCSDRGRAHYMNLRRSVNARQASVPLRR